MALTKNPKKRPTAEKLLQVEIKHNIYNGKIVTPLVIFQHAFFQGDMHRRLALELLQKVNNPSHMFTDLEPDEDGVIIKYRYLYFRIINITR